MNISLNITDDDEPNDDRFYKRLRIATREITPGPSNKRRRTETSSSTTVRTTRSPKELESIFIGEMQEQIRTIIQSYPEIANAAETREVSKTAMAKQLKLAKENLHAVGKHQKNIEHLERELEKENEMLDQCLETAQIHIAKFDNISQDMFLIRNQFSKKLDEIQEKIKNAGDVLGRILWNQFIENYAKTMNQRILSLMD